MGSYTREKHSDSTKAWRKEQRRKKRTGFAYRYLFTGQPPEPPIPPKPELVWASAAARLLGDPPIGRRAIDMRGRS